MRVFALGGAAIIVLAAAIVPLPWAVAEPGVLVAAADAVSITIDPHLQESARIEGPPSGEFFATRHRNGAPAIHLLKAAVLEGVKVERPSGEPSGTDVHPVVAAAMAGLGIVPRYADISELPVTARVTGPVDDSSLGLALHAFDMGTSLDVARGRRIAGVGRVRDDRLTCTTGIAAAVRAAAEQAIDVVVVPTDCATAANDAIPPGAALEVLDADVLATAAQALLDS